MHACRPSPNHRRRARTLFPVKWLLSSAVLLAIALVTAGLVTGRTLRQRDAAVREGILLRAAHDLERQLRESGPDRAQQVLEEFVAASNGSAVEIAVDTTVLAKAGTPEGEAVETPLFLGPAWRGVATGHGRGSGGGMGTGPPPFRMRLWPGSGAGDASRIAAVATWGAVVAALALLAFAAAAARGVAARQRATIADAERQRLQVVAAAGAGLAHRIRNPLATIKATAQVLCSQLSGASQEKATRIVDASVRIESLVSELLAFAKPVEVHPELLDLATVIGPLTAGPVDGANVHARADREHVMAAVEELVANAVHAGDARPEVAVRQAGRTAVVEVRDRGTGLQIESGRAFEPYVTTRADGTGLGLPTVRALIRANGGDIALSARAGGGCVATLTLPAVQR